MRFPSSARSLVAAAPLRGPRDASCLPSSAAVLFGRPRTEEARLRPSPWAPRGPHQRLPSPPGQWAAPEPALGLGQPVTNSRLRNGHSVGRPGCCEEPPNSRSGRSAPVPITPASPGPPLPPPAGQGGTRVCPAPYWRPLSGTGCRGCCRGLIGFGAASVSVSGVVSSGCGTPRQRVSSSALLPHQSTPDGTADGKDTDLLAELAARKSGTSLAAPAPGGQRSLSCASHKVAVLMTSFNLNYFLKGSLHTGESRWGRGLTRRIWGNTVQPSSCLHPLLEGDRLLSVFRGLGWGRQGSHCPGRLGSRRAPLLPSQGRACPILGGRGGSFLPRGVVPAEAGTASGMGLPGLSRVLPWSSLTLASRGSDAQECLFSPVCHVTGKFTTGS